MDLVQEKPDFSFVPRSADGRSVRINDRTLQRSFIIAAETLVEDWPVTSIESLTPEQLEPVFALQPEVFILGTGEHQGFPSPAVMGACLKRGIGIECMTNAAAARTFNVLAGEGRKAVAAFVLPG